MSSFYTGRSEPPPEGRFEIVSTRAERQRAINCAFFTDGGKKYLNQKIPKRPDKKISRSKRRRMERRKRARIASIN